MKRTQIGQPLSVPRVRRGAALLATIAAAVLLASGCRCKLVPWALAVDPSLTGTSDADGILEPGETVVVAPSWSKTRYLPASKPPFPPSDSSCPTSSNETGAVTSLTGPIQADYVIGVAAASYGTFGSMSSSPGQSAPRITKVCADCYEIFVSTPRSRPVSHWDARLTETLGGTLSASKTWTLHVGDSFTDVPRSNPFYQKIEVLLHKGITSGCSPIEYCPGQDVSRGQIAVFVARGLAGSVSNIPVAGTVVGQPYSCMAGGTSLFTDVDPADAFCKHIHFVAAKNLDPGCGPGLYCPGDKLNRLQMASFVANAVLQRSQALPGPQLEAPPLTYDDGNGRAYSCDPASPNLHFTDVPETDPLCKHVHYLWAKGIIAGCSATEYCPTREVTRDQMAKFLVNGFQLTLYVP